MKPFIAFMLKWFVFAPVYVPLSIFEGMSKIILDRADMLQFRIDRWARR